MQTFSLPDKLRELHAALLRRDIYPYLLLFAVTLAVWLPGGLDVGPYKLEDLRLLKEHGPDGAAFDPLITRLLRDLPVWIGMHLTPDGFEGWQGMILLLTLLRGWFLYALIRRMAPEHGLFALLCGLVALFHPADASYFYLDTPGVHLSLALALGASLCAVRYLQEGSRLDLTGMFLLQLGAGFSYSAFVPLMLALPAGAWLLERLRGRRPSPAFFAWVCAVPALLVALDLVMIHLHLGRDARVADFHAANMLAGYVHAAGRIPLALADLAEGFDPAYLPPVIAMGLLGALCAWLYGDRQASAGWKLNAAILAGLIGLALVGYLPYAFSTTRYSEKRQLLVAGIFAYSALLFLCSWATLHLRRRTAVMVLLTGVVAASVTLAGLEKRAPLMQSWRATQAVFADMTRLVPQPAHNAFILVQFGDPKQKKYVGGIYARQDTFIMALRFLYRSKTVSGAMTTGQDGRAQFGADGLRIHRYVGKKLKQPAFVNYRRLLVIRYDEDGQASLADADWVMQAAGVKTLTNRYAPGLLKVRGTDQPRTCSMLQAEYRPAYCSGGVSHKPKRRPAPAAATRAPGSSPAAGTR